MALAVSKAEREVQGSESVRDWCISYSNTACDVLAVYDASRVHTGYKAQSFRLSSKPTRDRNRTQSFDVLALQRQIKDLKRCSSAEQSCSEREHPRTYPSADVTSRRQRETPRRTQEVYWGT
ncbi:hypothetical protein M404DRAFT_600049 [Pisolithus tinctorius Marx 270]|uniref:Uncharacterized protein n=1 Tax=Pisolithus tinctorius Marx 270 TaxID=870435 RepID=A0A0C3NT27_PISTI|nr:hypothetical protein M404DRAFT_600049 [Pisolithus tinctorius Marx 270]